MAGRGKTTRIILVCRGCKGDGKIRGKKGMETCPICNGKATHIYETGMWKITER